jgi:Reverse transcriptase (RNA-dependent DNA polymerase)/Endonuclease-reverse transcriptase
VPEDQESVEASNIYEILHNVPEDAGSAPRTNTTQTESALSSTGGKACKKPSGFKIWTLNCQGVTSKAAELTDLVGAHKPDVIVLTETWLKEDATWTLPGYKGLHVNRKSQCARGEGGVAIYTKANLVARECTPSAYPDLAWTKLYLPGRIPLLVGGFYGPQESASSEKAKECFGILSKELSAQGECNKVLLGDFNAKIGNVHPQVGKYGPNVLPSRNGKLLHNVLETHNLKVVNGQAEGMHSTRHSEGAEPAMLDLIIIDTGCECPAGARVLRELDVGSDHLIVEATLRFSFKGPQRKETIRKRWNRERLLEMVEEARMAADSESPPPTEYELACSSRLKGWIEKAKHCNNIEELWSDWHAAVGEAARETIGEKVISGRHSRNYIDEEMREQIRERRKLFLEASHTSTSAAWKSYVEKRKDVARAVFAKKRSQWSRFNADIMKARSENPKYYWSLLKRLDKDNKNRNAVIELNRSDGKPCVSNAEVLEEFTQHFATVGLNTPGAEFDREWQRTVEESVVRTVCGDDSRMSTKDHTLVDTITAAEVQDAAKELSNGKACGRDGLPSELLKYGGKDMMESLALLFDKCRDSERTPHNWHLVNIVPIYKKGDKYSRANYRRVSLLSCVYKLYTRVLQRRLVAFLREHIVDEQAGFSAGKGCDDNLCIMTEVIERKVASREALYVALVDMRAAFDTVWRDGLWHKLQAMGVPHKLIRILKEIYSHGKFRVVANGEAGADTEAVTAGVLQGDVLSPDLFKAFINDLPQFLANAGCTGVNVSDMRKVVLLLFADDILLWGETQTELQLQLDSLRDYCRLWQLEVSAPKTHILLSPHAKLVQPLLYDGKELEVTENGTYLGVTFSGQGDFSAMIEKTVKKALGRQSALATILTNRQLPMLLRYTVWTTMVRPVLEWGSEVYTPPDVKVLESVQRAALRMIAGAQIHTPIVVLEGDFGACPMADRIDMRKCALMGKLHLAEKESILGQLHQQQQGQRKSTRGKKILKDEFKRLTKDVLVPAGLVNRNTGTCADESVSLPEWRDSARARILAMRAEKRAAELPKLSSLSHLVEYGTDYSSDSAHPYTTSCDGKAASLWFKIRSNTLPLGRMLAKSNKGVSDKCKCCKRGVREDLMHFLCDCPGLKKVRSEWLSSLMKEYPECTITLKDIPMLVLGPASALLPLPQNSTQQKVAAVEMLLKSLWLARNALHFGSRDAGGNGRPATFMRRSHGNTREYPGESRTDKSNDSYRLTTGIDTTAHGPLTRARAQLLLQSAHLNAEGPCQSGSTPQALRHPSNASDGKNDRAPCVQRSRSKRLESMEIISKT